MTTISYRGCTARPTSTTTDVRRSAFGRSYQSIGYVWVVEGRRAKSAMRRPFVTSATAVREWIYAEDALAADPMVVP